MMQLHMFIKKAYLVSVSMLFLFNYNTMFGHKYDFIDARTAEFSGQALKVLKREYIQMPCSRIIQREYIEVPTPQPRRGDKKRVRRYREISHHMYESPGVIKKAYSNPKQEESNLYREEISLPNQIQCDTRSNIELQGSDIKKRRKLPEVINDDLKDQENEALSLAEKMSEEEIKPLQKKADKPAITDQKSESAYSKLEKSLSFAVNAQKTKKLEKINCLLHSVGNQDMSDALRVLKYDLEFSDQVAVTVLESDASMSDQDLEALMEKEIFLYIKLEPEKNKLSSPQLRVIVKNILLEEVVFDKKYSLDTCRSVHGLHSLSDDVFLSLASTKGPMLSSLAYCAEVNGGDKTVFVADYACLSKKQVTANGSIAIAPAWDCKDNPVLYYSEFKGNSCKLLSLNVKDKKRSIVCDYDGLNLQPSFSRDGRRAAICFSGGKNTEIYLYDKDLCSRLKRKVFKQLTKNNGNNTSPCLLPGEDLIFCSDYEAGASQLYYLDKKTKKVKRLTQDNLACSGPSYCLKNKLLVYSKCVSSNANDKKENQLFLLDLSKKNSEEVQLTFNAGDKTQAAFSECGGYITFTYEYSSEKDKQRQQQIAVLNRHSGQMRILTSGSSKKSFPAWTNSPWHNVI